MLPFGNVAYRVNVMSAFFAALTVIILFKTTYRFFCSEQTEQRGASFATSTRSTRMRFIVVVVFCFMRRVLRLSRSRVWPRCIPFLRAWQPRFSIVFFRIIPMGLRSRRYSWAWDYPFIRRLFFWRRSFLRHRIHLLIEGRRRLFFWLGLSVFLYLPIRAAQHPLLNWGDPSHWRNFWRVVTRADYGGLKLHPEQSRLFLDAAVHL